jgi:hypothetical protein
MLKIQDRLKKIESKGKKKLLVQMFRLKVNGSAENTRPKYLVSTATKVIYSPRKFASTSTNERIA